MPARLIRISLVFALLTVALAGSALPAHAANPTLHCAFVSPLSATPPLNQTPSYTDYQAYGTLACARKAGTPTVMSGIMALVGVGAADTCKVSDASGYYSAVLTGIDGTVTYSFGFMRYVRTKYVATTITLAPYSSYYPGFSGPLTGLTVPLLPCGSGPLGNGGSTGGEIAAAGNLKT